MPYVIKTHCSNCNQADDIGIGYWSATLGLYICSTCKKLVNISADTGTCPTCSAQPSPQDMYDYSYAIPYLGGQYPGGKEPGPMCPKCEKARITFEVTMHTSMTAVVTDVEGAKKISGKNYMEKSIFINSMRPTIQEFQVKPEQLYAYFNIDIPKEPLITDRISFPIVKDIHTHIRVHLQSSPGSLGSPLSKAQLDKMANDEIQRILAGRRA